MPSRQMQLLTALFACLLPGLAGAEVQAAPAPTGSRPNLQANILIVTSFNAIEQWVLSSPAARGGDAGRLRKVTPGMRAFAPIAVTGSGAEGTPLSADFEFITPTGKVLMAASKCCSAVRGDKSVPGIVVLNPVPEVTLKASDPPGIYTLRATVTDGAHIWMASERFVLDNGSSPVEAAAPAKVLMNSPNDPRNCLQHSDALAVSRCAQKYR